MTDDEVGGSGDTGQDDLRAQLRAADPARSLPPLTDAGRARALEDAMSPQDEPDAHRTPDGYATREAGTRHRHPLTWVVAAAAVLVIAGVLWVGLRVVGGPDDLAGTDASAPTSTAPTADPDPTTDEAGPLPEGDVDDVTRLALPSAGVAPARCMVPNARVLDNQDLAFEGTATDVGGERVTFEVDRWYRGGDTATVVVEAVDPGLQRLLQAPDFTEGTTYLVSASDGLMTLCGFSDESDARLRALYEQAFA